MSIDISNSDDTINTRDVWKRIEELEELEEAVNEAKEAVDHAASDVKMAENAHEDGEGSEEDVEDAESALEDAEASLTSAEDAFDSDAEYELAALRKLQDQAEGYCDWHNGATLIRERHLRDYIQEQIEDTDSECLKALPSYIRDNIDWEGVCNDLESDYTEVDFDGTSYYLA